MCSSPKATGGADLHPSQWLPDDSELFIILGLQLRSFLLDGLFVITFTPLWVAKLGERSQCQKQYLGVAT